MDGCFDMTMMGEGGLLAIAAQCIVVHVHVNVEF